MLEIRVHGVSNTPPISMLQEYGTPPPGEPELVDGDDTTGFYRRPGGSGTWGLDVQAYSWGQLTQGGRLGKKDIQRAAWTLLLPFALSNVAMWAVPLRKDRSDRSQFASWLARCLAVSLTATFALGFSGLAVDQIAWQCRTGCTHTVPYSGFLREGWFAVGTRPMAAAALAPLLVVGLLALVAQRTFSYEAHVPQREFGHSSGNHPFVNEHFWNGRTQIHQLALLHLSAALATIGLVVAAGTRAVDTSATGRHLSTIACVVLLIAVAGTLAALASKGVRTRGATDNAAWLLVPLASASGGFVLALLAALVWPGHAPDGRKEWPGFSGAIAALFASQVTVLILLAALGAATLWRAAILFLGAVLAAGVVAVRAGSHAGHAFGAKDAVVLAVAVLLVLVTLASPPAATSDPPIAWRGKGAALFAGAGLMTAVVFMSSALFALANWLNGSHTVTSNVSQVVVPTALLWSGVGLLLAVLGLLAVVISMYSVMRRIATKAARPDAEQEEGAPTIHQQYAPVQSYEDGQVRAVARGRAVHLLDGYHAIGYLGILAGIGLAICVCGAAATVLGLIPAGPDAVVSHPGAAARLMKWITDVGGSFSGLIVFAIGYLLLNVYREKGVVRRVFGIVWDLATFWPRGAHPFAPPCYAERTVPELVTKVHGQRGTVLATHSQGCLIGMATLFQLRHVEDVRFLTFGSQLTRLYGRIFPLYFGAPAQGMLVKHLCHTAADPRWISLWRPTDYLGWKLADDASDAGPLDVQVKDPVALSGPEGVISLPVIHKHSDYPLSREYVEERNRLVESLRRDGA